MMEVTQQFISFLVLLGIYMPATAERMQRLEDSWYIGGSIGASTLDPAVSAGSNVTDDKSFSIKGYAGVDISENIGLEAFWTGLGKSGISGSAGNGAIKYSAIGVNGIFYLPVNTGRMHPFGKFGIAKINTRSTDVLLNQKNNFAVFGGLGTDYDLSRQLKIRAEYNYFTEDISEVNIGLKWSPGRRAGMGNYANNHGNAIPAALPIVLPTKQPAQPRNLVKVKTTNTSLSGASLFKSGSATLNLAGIQRLNRLINRIQNPNFKLYHIIISGHTDNRGKAARNLRLSKRRAESVARYLVSRGVSRSKMSVVGYGESQPVVSNATAYGRARNRRVEITIKGVQSVVAAR